MRKLRGRELRHARIRKRVFGTDKKPRLVVYRSLRHLYAQLVDDIKKRTITSVSTNTPALREKIKTGGNVKAAQLLGEAVACAAKASGIKEAAFDRSGYRYHGRVKALAEAALKNGLSFGQREEKTVSKEKGETEKIGGRKETKAKENRKR